MIMETIGVFVLAYLCSVMAGLSYGNDHAKGCSVHCCHFMLVHTFTVLLYTPSLFIIHTLLVSPTTY